MSILPFRRITHPKNYNKPAKYDSRWLVLIDAVNAQNDLTNGHAKARPYCADAPLNPNL